MSQEKVDQRKKDKEKRKKKLAGRKRKRFFNICLSVVLTVVFLGIVTLAAGSLSGKLEKETTTTGYTLSADELASLQEALGNATGTDSEEATTVAETAADGSAVETAADGSVASEAVSETSAEEVNAEAVTSAEENQDAADNSYDENSDDEYSDDENSDEE